MMHCWCIDAASNTSACMMQGCQYTCVVETPERVVFAVGSDRKIKELADGGNGMQVPDRVLRPSSEAGMC